MMNRAYFDKLVEILHGPVGYRWLMQQQLDSTILFAAVQCFLVGMETEGMELLAKSDSILSAKFHSIPPGPSIHGEMFTHYNLAQCRWLLGPPATAPDLSRAIVLLDEEEATVPESLRDETFDGAIPMRLEAGQAAKCVEIYQRYHPKYPPARRRHHRPGAMAYLLARQQIHGTLNNEELAKLNDDFLKRQVPELLNRGQYPTFVRWVRLTTGAAPGLAARTAIREIAERYM